ncbi:MFS transporter [Luteolibacter algae]|uniref:MFS transporter n=1 Tax=Luteolibacter algae TaxID=454151 RepID=A0ABW5D866_9BACT
MPVRLLLLTGTFLISLLLYIDRTCIQVAGDAIKRDLNLTDTQFGWILSIFTLGYALGQTPSGILADRHGPRKLLTGVIGLWSVLTAVTASGFNFISMMVIRFLFGASEAGAFPGMARATLNWFPVKERGLVTGINFSASRLGGAAALPLMVWLIEAAGWKGSFHILGGIGVIFAIVWFLLFRDTPEEAKNISGKERDYIIEHRQKINRSADAPEVGFGQLVSDRNVILLMAQYFCSNFTFFFCLSWLFKYVKDTYGLAAADTALLAALPLLGGAAGNWFSGWLVDRLYQSKGVTISRRIPAIVGFVLATAGLLLSLQMATAFPAVICLTIAVFGADMTLASSWSCCVDIGGKSSGAVSGTMNMAGNLGSFATSLAFPYLLAWFGSTTPFFFIAASLNAAAVIFWFMIRPDEGFDARSFRP